MALALLACVSCAGKADDDRAARPTTTRHGTTTTVVASTTTAPPTGAGPATTLATRDVLAMPKAGDYTFHDSVSGKNLRYALSVGGTTVRLTETSTGAAYDERHDPDGLWLVSSATSGGVCDWQPKVASLPQAVIDGGTVSTSSTCGPLTMTQTVTFKAFRTVTIDGVAQRCVDVTRHRVITGASTPLTADAVDTYAFALGVRVATDEHGTEGDRNLVLVSLPS